MECPLLSTNECNAIELKTSAGLIVLVILIFEKHNGHCQTYKSIETKIMDDNCLCPIFFTPYLCLFHYTEALSSRVLCGHNDCMYSVSDDSVCFCIID